MTKSCDNDYDVCHDVTLLNTSILFIMATLINKQKSTTNYTVNTEEGNQLFHNIFIDYFMLI